MEKLRITKIFSFEMAHALKDYEGLCRNVHGHSYRLWVTVIGEPESNGSGMLMDFSLLKKCVKENIVDKFDHALAISKGEDMEFVSQMKKRCDKLLIMPTLPTSEMLICRFVDLLNGKLPENVRLYSMKLAETDTSYVEWYAEDNGGRF